MNSEVEQPVGMKPMTEEEREAQENPRGYLFMRHRDYSRNLMQLLVTDGRPFWVGCNTRNEEGIYKNKHSRLSKEEIIKTTGDMYIKRWTKRERVFLNHDGTVDDRKDVSRCHYCYSEYCHNGDLCSKSEPYECWYYEYRDVDHEEINPAVKFITEEEWESGVRL